MIRGTTPTFELELEDFDIQSTDEVHMYFSQRNKMVLEIPPSRVVINTTDKTVKAELTQEETYEFKKNVNAKVELRIKTSSGVVYGSDTSTEITFEVTDIADDDEVI